MTTQPTHPRQTRARILLCSVFGPYAQDDEFGSRRINPMELYQNQVTRFQGPFSLRMFHRSFGLMMIQENLDAPCTLLDFPSQERFVQELQRESYDIVGIGAIIPNVEKVRHMCRLIRRHQPNAAIVVGGHVAGLRDLEARIDADHIVRGEGVRWFRRYVGQDPDAPIRHPAVLSGFGTRILGHGLADKPGDTAAILIPSVGCPMGCNFCSTSALFGGKGKFISFYETGDELFAVMQQLESRLKVRSFFTMDENFLFHRKRALRLLELMKANGKSWSLYVFSSARVLQSYSIEQLVRLGISWVWMGVEGESSRYSKLSGVDTVALVDQLQSHGIRVLGSSIIGLENHSPDTIDAVIDRAVRHDTVFHQFMLYTPNPGTALWESHRRDGTLMPESRFPLADTHGQFRFNYRHPIWRDGSEEAALHEAFKRDFRVNGPSLARMIRVVLNGWQRYRNHPDPCVRDRYAWEVAPLKSTYAGAVWAMRRWYRDDRAMAKKLDVLLCDIYRTFGWKTRVAAPAVGRYLSMTIRAEQRRLSAGWSYEPPLVREDNAAARRQRFQERGQDAPAAVGGGSRQRAPVAG